ncbi:hypothetical protein CVIRNUC_000226 [Coccomyxa viridis]|uniref:Uncharacterized protein n=1 Tax=Coccomyxa viridis TaxID=1274662 RepID=A0AAV1HQD7_9CHLO|nr:hypothetical protein CVIRNUC_000226 [Coccomyxa viridis]
MPCLPCRYAAAAAADLAAVFPEAGDRFLFSVQVMGPTQLLLLKRIFICITFHWRVTRLPTLKLVLKSIAEFPTSTSICVITNQPEYLAAALWNLPNVEMCGNSKNLSHPYRLAWNHRDVVKAALRKAYMAGFASVGIRREPARTTRLP